MIYLTRPPYATWHGKGAIIHHFNIFIDGTEDREYYGINQQIEAQIMGLA